jgi:hypothetical protein
MCTREKRVHDIVYSCDDRQDLAERIVNLEVSNSALAVELDELNEERNELLDYAHLLWALLVASGNDDLVLEMMMGERRITIDAEEMAGRLRHLGVKVDQPIDFRKWANK